jgi:hypothetical protein
MMTRSIQHHERRHSGRVSTTGTIMVRARDVHLHGRIVDVSARGARIAVAGSDRMVTGTRVALRLRLDGVHARWLHLLGRVARVERDHIAIEFRVVPRDFEDVIQRELVAALERDRVPAVIVVDADSGRRALVASAFRAAGCRVQEAIAALDVVHALDDSRAHPWLLAIADTSPMHTADDLRAYLKLAYPRIPRIVIGARQAGNGSRISVDERPDLAMQVQGLVGARDHAG